MKTVRKKRSKWQIFLWGLRHPLMYSRAVALQEIRRKRLHREYIECTCTGYDPEFEREWKRQQRESENYIPASTFMEMIGAVPRRKADKW